MDKNEREIIREMFTDVLATHSAVLNGEFKVIKTELSSIKIQTTKTNGRVTSLEKEVGEIKLEEVQHIINCPNTQRIGTLEKSDVSRKSVLKFISISIGITLGVIGIVFTIMTFIIKLKP
jgi:hypothetical protein